jgi:hypothetical protein
MSVTAFLISLDLGVSFTVDFLTVLLAAPYGSKS